MTSAVTAQLHIVVIDDNKELRTAIRFVLEDEGYRVSELESPLQARDSLLKQAADLILLDMNFQLDTTSGEEGLRFLRFLAKQYPDIPVIAMTAWSNTQLVVAAMQAGASDFLEKPWQNQRLVHIVSQQLKLSQLQARNQALFHELEVHQQEQQHSDMGDDFAWQSPVMRRLMQQLKTVALTDATILLTGENGTGKSQLAHWLHQHSSRQQGPLISVNMAAIPETLFESELFGHKKGAFTDAKETRAGRLSLAAGGSLFLDEIACLPISLQAKLLRVLETGEFEALGSSRTEQTNIRLISATNGNIAELIQQGLFRQDLYYRLNTLEFRIPALRERPEDIAPLCEFFLHQHGARYQKRGLSLSRAAITQLQQYPWPGNLRELSHLLERAVLLSQSSLIDVADLALPLHLASPGSDQIAASGELAELTLEQAELQLIRRALSRHPSNKQKAADELGITKSSLYRRLEKYGLV
ncbi:sigma-54 dependent transcriptional regulator [Shewanella sp. JM162201]|uniref:Sigma-54 dependent transcriptional regulator n=2 Tax=Shewanella jiangmenensis TaxID=2837387 RepID=A0ABS5V872_9GAMM|nr:sigma-54 dependent transcriptional regulator [Shewanella jiangmenensis]